MRFATASVCAGLAMTGCKKVCAIGRPRYQLLWNAKSAELFTPRSSLLFFSWRYRPVMVSMTASSSGSRVFCIDRPSSISKSTIRPLR